MAHSGAYREGIRHTFSGAFRYEGDGKRGLGPYFDSQAEDGLISFHHPGTIFTVRTTFVGCGPQAPMQAGLFPKTSKCSVRGSNPRLFG
jgi:hypothetical protein